MKRKYRVDLDAIARIYQNVDREVAAVMRQRREQGDPIPCRRGCDSCCYDAVQVAQFEVLPIVEAIRRLDQKQQDSIRAGIGAWCENMAAKSIGIDDAEPSLARYYAAPRARCPLLDQATRDCLCYAARPLACRTYVLIGENSGPCDNRARVFSIPVIDPNPILTPAYRKLITASVKRGAANVAVTAVMLPTMLLRAWSLVEAPGQRDNSRSYRDWLDRVF
jgi:Fe-S-cluster containining protein